MRLRSAAVGLLLAGLGVFALLNWGAFTAPTTLSLGFSEVQAPLGLVMLVVAGALAVLFLVHVVLQQAGVIAETRRHAREMKAQRELADKAEASRYTELRALIEDELRRVEMQRDAASRALGERLEALEQRLGQRLEDSTQTLAACVGEVDDKLDRLHAGGPPPPELIEGPRR